MCYDIKASLEAQLNRARRRNDAMAIEEIIEKLAPLTDLPIFHKSGFSHPELLMYTDRSPIFPEVATWGLVPSWVKDHDQLKKLWNSTLNARGETIFEKPSFSESAKHKRCIIYIDGFFEHHHYNGKIYPFYISRRNKEPIALAGLWNEWRDPDSNGVMKTFTIVTTAGNDVMSKIHNNPKLKEPRMPCMLTEENEDKWLAKIETETAIQTAKELIQQFPNKELIAHTVGKLRGKQYVGNVPEIVQEVIYPDLQF